jgi:predicted ABC-type ATPase
MWLVAGPNGSGKSTFANSRTTSLLSGSPLTKFNADDVARDLRIKNRSLSQDQADLQAVRTIDAKVKHAVENGKSLLVETVLSSDKYKATVARATDLGFLIGLIYITLNSPELNVARVKLRVELGGHDVPKAKINSRWERSLLNLPWFVERASVAFIYDNSGASAHGAELIAVKEMQQKLRLIRKGLNTRIETALEPLLGH